VIRSWVLIAVLALTGLAAPVAPARAQDNAGETDPVAAAMIERAQLQAPRMVHQALAALEEAERAGNVGDDARAATLVDAAIAYDPGSVRARLAKARRARTPGELFSATAATFEAMRYGFPNQLLYSLNAFLILLWSVMLGLLGAGGAIVFRYARHVHHTLYESLQRRVGKHAALFATLLLFIPALWGTGLIPLVMFFLLWFRSIMRARERAVVYALGAVTLIFFGVHQFGVGPLHALDERHGPYRVAVAAETGATEGYRDALGVDEPEGYASWARGLVAKRRGNLELAQQELSAAVERLPRAFGALTTLGNVRYLRGDLDGALAAYDRAIELEPTAPEPHLNRAQVLTERVDFIGADAAMEQAMTHGYGRVSHFLEMHADVGGRVAMDALPQSADLWMLTLKGTGVHGRLPTPAGFTGLMPGGRLGLLPYLMGIMAALGIAAGRWLERSVKTHACTSCGRIICRRCLVRVEGNPYCLDCGQTLKADCSAEFSRALLERYFQKGFSVRTALSGTVRWLLPGWAEVSEWPVVRSVFVLSLCGAALLVVSTRALPVPGYPADATGLTSAPLSWAIGVVLYAIARLATWRWSSTRDDEESDTDVDEGRDFGHAA
jgi:tetratricopeptide (TPR) repeat protein